MQNGKLYGIGIGPGDPELLTLKARRVLESLEVLLVPQSRQEKRSLALSIAQGAVQREWECIELVLPMTEDQEELQQHWQAAARRTAQVLSAGRDAGFITLGDPSLYSTFTYLLKELQLMMPQLEFEIIPGVSSVHAMAAWIGQPLAEGRESLVIVPALAERADLHEILERFDNVVLLKAGGHTDKLVELLRDAGGERGAFFISRCGFADGFFTSDLDSLTGRPFDYLSSMIIKKKRGELL